MRLTIFLLILYIAILTAGCSGHAGRESTADGAHNTQFDKTISKADSLYNCMQFRDAGGRQASATKKGVVIVDGKKVVVK
jgi:hypothetical protein